MRVLPLALLHSGHGRGLARDAHRQSLVTHGQMRSQVCCALYGLWARRTLAGVTDGWADAVATLRSIYRSDALAENEVESFVRPDDDGAVSGTHYVVDALRLARWACVQGSYESVVRAAISLGNDTDTTTAIAGGIAGLRDGVDAIPERWKQRLRGREIYEPSIERLLAAVG